MQNLKINILEIVNPRPTHENAVFGSQCGHHFRLAAFALEESFFPTEGCQTPPRALPNLSIISHSRIRDQPWIFRTFARRLPYTGESYAIGLN
jgi:hypothetical protein